MKFSLEEIHTASASAKIWGIPYSTLKDDLTRYKKFQSQIARGLAKKEDRVWLISEEAMKEVYGEKRSDNIV